MTDKILYFTAGRIPTTAEKAEIAAIEALCVLPYSVGVRNPIDSPSYGTPEEADYVSGTIPEEEPYASLPEFDPANPPTPSLPATEAIVANGATVAVRNSAGADSHNATAVVANNAVTGVNLAATVAIVDNSDSIAVLPASGSSPAFGNAAAAVAAGVVTGVRLPAASAVVTNGQVINVTGGTVTISVAANVVTAAFTPTP